jgi:tRNA-specific 2-thiouridylase
VLCNRYVKFGALLDRARELGAGFLATGHYARVIRDEDGRCRLFSGLDRAKDQAYFLFRLTQRQLAQLVFPLGTRAKCDVQAYVEHLGLPCRELRESTDLCFAASRAYPSFVAAYRPDLVREGELVSMDGRKLGMHAGIHNFTVGQRRGLGVAAGTPLYVVRIEADGNRVVLGPRSELMRRSFAVTDVSWIRGRPPEGPAIECVTRIRSSHAGAASRVRLRGDAEADVEFDALQFGLTPGQAAVFYTSGERGEVLGGGWIGEECPIANKE